MLGYAMLEAPRPDFLLRHLSGSYPSTPLLGLSLHPVIRAVIAPLLLNEKLAVGISQAYKTATLLECSFLIEVVCKDHALLINDYF